MLEDLVIHHAVNLMLSVIQPFVRWASFNTSIVRFVIVTNTRHTYAFGLP